MKKHLAASVLALMGLFSVSAYASNEQTSAAPAGAVAPTAEAAAADEFMKQQLSAIGASMGVLPATMEICKFPEKDRKELAEGLSLFEASLKPHLTASVVALYSENFRKGDALTRAELKEASVEQQTAVCEELKGHWPSIKAGFDELKTRLTGEAKTTEAEK